jgi:hypothetical protein
MSRPNWQVYEDGMIKEGRGFPLWKADPGNGPPPEIGTIGYFMTWLDHNPEQDRIAIVRLTSLSVMKPQLINLPAPSGCDRSYEPTQKGRSYSWGLQHSALNLGWTRVFLTNNLVVLDH